jgi:hypothetical protein
VYGRRARASGIGSVFQDARVAAVVVIPIPLC